MKQLISLILIMLITIISWSSCAKNTEIRVNAIYYQSSVSNSIILKPSLAYQQANENFALTPNQPTNKHNEFFEFAIIFNEKLQQFIAFFTKLSDKIDDAITLDFSSSKAQAHNNLSAMQKCKASS